MRNMLLVAVATLSLVAHPALDAPIEVASPFHFRDSRSNDPAGLTPGDLLTFGARFVTPNPRTEDGGTVVTATQAGTAVVVPCFDSPASPAEQVTSVASDPAGTGALTLTVTNPASANSPVSVVTPDVLRSDGSIAGNPEFVRNMSPSGSGTDLTFSFAAPPGSEHDRVAIRIFDLERRTATGGATLVFVR